jgi:shikimate dehydrogenase
MTQHIGLIGYPLKHSLSPEFQQAALDCCHLDIRYESWETEADKLPSVINQLRQAQNLGANVTVPYKEKVLHFMDEVDNLASMIGAVNTIVNQKGRLIGFNTDVEGFLRGLCDDAKFEPVSKRTLILGAGGAARAVSFALLRGKVSYLAIANRTLARAEILAASLTKYSVAKGMQVELFAVPWQKTKIREIASHCQLIVNCTTMGMRHSALEGQSPLPATSIPEGALVYDLVYNPFETPLLKIAKEAGADILGGLPMLVYQGAASFKLWTGREAPVDIMFKIAKQVLTPKRGAE